MADQALEIELHAYVDGVLDDEGMARVEAYLKDNPEAAAQAEAYMRQRQDLRDFAFDATAAPEPRGMAALETQLARALRQDQPAPKRLFVMAVAVAFLGFGWLGHSVYQQRVLGHSFTEEIRVAHLMLANDSTEIAPATPERLARLFSRIGEPLHLPDLSSFDFKPVGANLQPSNEGPVLQILYRNPKGISLSYFLLHDQEYQSLPLRLLHLPSMTVAFWQQDYTRHAIVGALSDQQARAIAAQLSPSPATPRPQAKT